MHGERVAHSPMGFHLRLRPVNMTTSNPTPATMAYSLSLSRTTMTTIEITGLDRIAHKLKTIEQLNAVLEPPMRQSLMHLQRRIARPPRKDPTAFTRLATPKQKRAYWARVRAGEIDHGKNGYRRTNTLARKWSIKISGGSTFMVGSLINNAGYGVFVQGDRQQPFHAASKWPTVDDVADKERAAVQRYFDAAIKRAID